MNLLIRQLERRFGPLPEEAIGKLNAAWILATLEDWSLRLVDAHSRERGFKVR